MNHFPYDIYKLDCYSLTYHALARFKQIVTREDLPECTVALIEDQLIPTLEHINAE